MIKIIEGTAAHIEEEGNKLIGYNLDSMQFTIRSTIYTNDAGTTVSERQYNFYVAIFKSESFE